MMSQLIKHSGESHKSKSLKRSQMKKNKSLCLILLKVKPLAVKSMILAQLQEHFPLLQELTLQQKLKSGKNKIYLLFSSHLLLLLLVMSLCPTTMIILIILNHCIKYLKLLKIRELGRLLWEAQLDILFLRKMKKSKRLSQKKRIKSKKMKKKWKNRRKRRRRKKLKRIKRIKRIRRRRRKKRGKRIRRKRRKRRIRKKGNDEIVSFK